MIRIKFGASDDTIINVEAVFDNNYEEKWFIDPLVKEMVRDIDQSTIIAPNCIESPVLGQISPRELSGGVKALILMLEEDYEIWATACGDNCAKWILKIGELRDITICLEHYMNFPTKEFTFIDDRTGRVSSDYFGCAIQNLARISEAQMEQQ